MEQGYGVVPVVGGILKKTGFGIKHWGRSRVVLRTADKVEQKLVGGDEN